MPAFRFHSPSFTVTNKKKEDQQWECYEEAGKTAERIERFDPVEVIEQGKRTASLCLQPLECVPSADIVVMHKLMIEADEETYLQTANRFPPALGLDW